MEAPDKDPPASLAPAVDTVEATVPRNVRWNPADLERIERAAQILGERERLNLTAADIIRRGTMKEVDAIEQAA